MNKVAALAFGASLAASPVAACDVELILAMDVSRSVMNAEYDLQMQGLASAFRDQAVLDLIEVSGGVMATLTQWSGQGDQSQTVPWRFLQEPETTLAFAEKPVWSPSRRHDPPWYKKPFHSIP